MRARESTLACNLGNGGLSEICQALVDSNNYSLALLNVMNNQITAEGIQSLKLLFDYKLFHIIDLSLASERSCV